MRKHLLPLTVSEATDSTVPGLVSDTVQHPGRKQVVDKMAHFMPHRKQKEEAGDRTYSAPVQWCRKLGPSLQHPWGE